MNWCELCDNYTSLDECNCKPFAVIDPDGDEEIYHASSREEAARKFAVDYNEDGDYSLMNESIEIEVDGKKYRVGAEPDIYYFVKSV